MNLLAQAPLMSFQTRGGTVTSDANGFIYNVTAGQLLNDLLGAGCMVLTPGALFGSGTALALTEGNIYRTVSAGVTPGGTGSDYVLAVYSLPANSFDGIGNRGLNIQAFGAFANDANTKRAKIIFNPTAAVVGSVITGGTTIADTGAQTGANIGWNIGAQVFKYGAPNSNTQYSQETNVIIGGVHAGMGLPIALTAAENAAILIAVTGNAGTLATDVSLSMFEVNALN